MAEGLPRRGFLAGAGPSAPARSPPARSPRATTRTARPPRTIRHRPVPRRPPGRHRHRRPGPARVRGVRPHDDRSRDDLVAMLRTWTEAAAAMTLGQPVPGDSTSLAVPPADTGEAMGLDPPTSPSRSASARRCSTSGSASRDRKPAALEPIPHLPGDLLAPGDQRRRHRACSAAPTTRRSRSTRCATWPGSPAAPPSLRWSQLGFGRTSSTTHDAGDAAQPDGLQGRHAQRQGRRRPVDGRLRVGRRRDRPGLDARAAATSSPAASGCCIESWDRDFLGDQEAVIGRFKDSGAPLDRQGRVRHPRLRRQGRRRRAGHPDGRPRPAGQPRGERRTSSILRRGYSFTDGVDPRPASSTPGCSSSRYQKDPHEQFVPLQRKLGRNDALNEYIKHVSSGVWACPPGVAPRRVLGPGALHVGARSAVAQHQDRAGVDRDPDVVRRRVVGDADRMHAGA